MFKSRAAIFWIAKITFIPDPRYSDSEKRYATQHNIKQDVSSTHRQPYPQEHEINLPRHRMKF
ncbi:hypothetical protein B0A71_13845 [Flavobacterium tructae]|uniref:Uncharacterized protein n=1 Tax=Flavobacterium tructae TaxID=1114873 RepID=A0ABX4D5I4_9FLAO|nr:hypothetical protein B0A71_13845 [Flavobacterium tructae]